MKKVRLLLTVSFIAFIVLGMMSSASALLFTPATSLQSGSNPNNPDAGDIPGIVGYTGTLDLLYKQDVGNEGSLSPAAEGTFASSYSTTFSNTSFDPEDATITHVEGMPVITGTPLYLLVKDGNHDPIWYIFDLSSWHGIDTIYLEDFWAPTDSNPKGQGAISHVDIFGIAPVPEPSTLLLLGAGLVGFGILGRRKFKRS